MKAINKKELKLLYEKDFYKWITENIKLLRNRQFDLVDWENVIEELEDIRRNELRNAVSLMITILEHLYKWENFEEDENTRDSWIDSINNARVELEYLFSSSSTLKKEAKKKTDLAWEIAVKRLVIWLKRLAGKHLEKTLIEKSFPKKCPYTFKQVLEYEPWINTLRSKTNGSY